jgi:diketogulonate reductase-like aldo/keto reductase
VAIPGTANVEHLAENFAQQDWSMPEDLATELDRLINQHTVAGARYSAAAQNTVFTEEFS